MSKHVYVFEQHGAPIGVFTKKKAAKKALLDFDPGGFRAPVMVRRMTKGTTLRVSHYIYTTAEFLNDQ